MFDLYMYFIDPCFQCHIKISQLKGVTSGRSLRRLVLEDLVASSVCIEDLKVEKYLLGCGGRRSLPIWLAHRYQEKWERVRGKQSHLEDKPALVTMQGMETKCSSAEERDRGRWQENYSNLQGLMDQPSTVSFFSLKIKRWPLQPLDFHMLFLIYLTYLNCIYSSEVSGPMPNHHLTYNVKPEHPFKRCPVR